MGADFNTIAFVGTKEQVLREWNSEVEQAQYECGHGGNYTGSISELGKGFSDTGKVFNSRSEAEDYIEEHHQKWDGAMAVQYFEGSAPQNQSKKKQVLSDKANKLRGIHFNLEKKLSQDIKNAKSKTVGCKNCDSKVNRDFLNSSSCPVCGKTLLSDTAQTRIQNSYRNWQKALSDYDSFEPKAKATGKKKWLVGGWCSS